MTTLPNAWADRAGDLAGWTVSRLVNRTDAWGGYRPPSEWNKEFQRQDGTTGKLGATTTHKGRLDSYYLGCHFRAMDRGTLIGLHSTSPDSTSKWGALDIDWHGPTSTAPDINVRAALAWYDRLARDGFRPLLVDSNGAGGFHLWILFASPAPTPRVYSFLRRLTTEAMGMAKPPECFPKQAFLRPLPDGRPGYGNWLRVPGRHHSREHWSRVWDGSRWLDGHLAIDFMLALQGDPLELLPEVPASPPPSPPLPRRQYARPVDGDNRAMRAAAYLNRLPNLGEGQGRDDVAYQFAAFLARDLDLDDHVALDWLTRWDQGNNPPKGEQALAEILGNARKYGRHAIGSGLTTNQTQGRARRHHKATVLQFSVRIQG